MPYFAASVFISAFLLFQIQPMIGKLLLPWFGGTPTVWSVVLMFFQLLLIGGYAYAFWLISHLSKRKQSNVHLAVLATTLILTLILALLWPSPVTPDASWKPDTTSLPIWHIFILLTISVGLPYFLLATNAPLMQAWFSKSYPSKSPYRLYSLSNTGSLLALISYPFLIEPEFSMRWQGMIWSGSFICFVLLTTYITLRMRRISEKIPVITTAPASKPATSSQILWIALSACASILLLATTNQMTQEIAAIPFLWILPLTLYLLSFIVTFNSERWYNRVVFSFLLLFCSVAFIAQTNAKLDLIAEINTYSFLLFVCCMICNGELYSLRPDTTYLTRFYLMIAIGGASGGIIVTFIAPLIFNGYWELECGFALCWVLLSILVFLRPSALKKNQSIIYQAVVLMATLVAVTFALRVVLNSQVDVRLAKRNFYGVIHVKEAAISDVEHHVYLLKHGTTLHGFEFISPQKRDQPSSYFATNSGVALAITHHPHYHKALRVGVLGLGIGTLAAYGQPGDIYRFYEINPAIISLAKGQGGYFHFLSDSHANISIVLGDARITLEKELTSGQNQHFDVLVLDTFSSDAIPVHLLTREAFAIYLAHLAQGGVLAVHISNRNLDLQPVVWQLAKFYQLQAVSVDTTSQGFYKIRSNWILLSHDGTLLTDLVNSGAARWLSKGNKPIRIWTDDYSNLFQILK